MTEDATFWRMEAERHAPAPLGTIGQNTISRAELGAYGRRHGWGRDTAGAVVDDIVAHREPYEPADETRAPSDSPHPVAADLTPAQCEALRRMTEEWGDALDAVRQAVDLLGARIHSAEDARVIAGARDALRVLEGAETPAGGSVPDDNAREPASALVSAQEPSGGKDGSEDEAVPRLCPTCLHDGVLERTLERAEAAEARIADLENTIGQATVMAESMAGGGRLDPDCALRLLSTLGTSPRDLEAIGTGPLLDPDCRDGKCGSCTGAPCEHECHAEKPGEREAGNG